MNQQTETQTPPMRKLKLTGANNYTCRNPDPNMEEPLQFKARSPNGEPIVYQVTEAMALYLLHQRTSKRVAFFTEHFDHALPTEGASVAPTMPVAGEGQSMVIDPTEGPTLPSPTLPAVQTAGDQEGAGAATPV